MGGVIDDAEVAGNDLGYTGRRPDSTGVAERPGAALQHLHQLGALGFAQSPGPARRATMAQRLTAFMASASDPLVNGAFRDPQGSGDAALAPAGLIALPSAKPAAFAPGLRDGCLLLVHAVEDARSSNLFMSLGGDQ